MFPLFVCCLHDVVVLRYFRYTLKKIIIQQKLMEKESDVKTKVKDVWTTWRKGQELIVTARNWTKSQISCSQLCFVEMSQDDDDDEGWKNITKKWNNCPMTSMKWRKVYVRFVLYTVQLREEETNELRCRELWTLFCASEICQSRSDYLSSS